MPSLLRKVIRSGKVELIEILRAKGISFEFDEQPSLLETAADGGMHMLKYIKDLSPDDQSTKYALARAASRGETAVVQYFLDQGCDPNAKYNDMSYLDIAVSADDTEAAIATLDLLLRYGADINQVTGHYDDYYENEFSDGKIHLPSEGEHESRIVRFLVECGVDPHPDSSPWTREVLMTAALRECMPALRFMLDAIAAREESSFDDLVRAIDFIRDTESPPPCWGYVVAQDPRIIKFLDRYYWRARYPVPS